jgi:hypothetical protein
MKSYKKLIAVTALSVFVFIGIAAVDKPANKDFKNLQVLPKNITADSLDKIMDGFNAGLGVDCKFCHTWNQDIYKMEFDKDTKPEKEIARKMMRMTMEVNKKYFQFNEEVTAAQVQAITCYTCHKGEPIAAKEKKAVNKPPFNFKSN